MTLIQKRISEIFTTLSFNEQNLLLVLSVTYSPIGQMNLTNLLKQTGFDLETQKTVNRDFKERFSKMGFLIASNEGWSCHREICDGLIKTALTKPWFNNLAQQIIMERESLYLPPKQMISQQMKKLRLFLYQGNETGFEANIAMLYSNSRDYFDKSMEELFFENFDKTWFMSLPNSIRFSVLKYSLLSDYFSFHPTLNSNKYKIYDLLEESFGGEKNANEEITHFVLEQRLFRGNDKDAQNWLETDLSADSLKLFAILAILKNRYDYALELFAEALKLIRKGNKKTATFGGFYDFFYGLMLFRSRTLPNLQLLDAYITTCFKKAQAPDSLLILLHDALEIYQGKRKFPGSSLSHQNGLRAPYQSLVQLLLRYWLDETENLKLEAPRLIFLTPLANYCQAAQELNNIWYAAIGSALLQRLEYSHKACDKIAKNYANSPFIELLDAMPKTAAWERALEALSQINSLKTSPTANAVQSESRMVWTLNLDNSEVVLEPKEQKLGKNGSWSKGRNVALKRLHGELNTFTYLTEQDVRICKKIRKFSQSNDYYYYNTEAYEVPEEALFEAVGHPNVYWSNQVQYNSPIDIQTAEPQLLVQEEGNQLLLALQPQISPSAKMAVQKTASGVLLYKINDQHRQVAQTLGDGLKIPISARQQVMDSISAIASTLTVQSNMVGLATQAENVPVDERLHLHLQPLGQGLQIEVFVQPFFDGGPLYKPATGGTTVLAEIDGKQLQTSRDFKLEKKYVKRLLESCPLLEPNDSFKWSLEEADSALETLLGLQELGDFALLEWPKGKKIRLSRELGLSQTRFAVRHEQNWFSVEGDLQIDDGQVLDMQRLMSLLANSSSRFLQLEDGQIVTLTKELRQRLDDLRGVGEVKDDKVQFHTLAAQALDEITDGMSIKASKPWKDQLKKLNELVDLQPKVPSTLQGELRDYQHEGFVWMSRLAHWGAGACLADDMGLGKTIQSLALILSRAPNGATLILAPTSVCINWAEEAARFAPTLNVQVFGSGDRQTMLDNAGAFDLIICSYGLLQTEGERLQEVEWHTLIADEAQAIKNGMTKRSKAAMALKADFRMVTTGTPIENHLGELWNLFNFINPSLLGSLAKFNERYANPIENNHDHNAQQRLKKVLRPFILRRLKNDVLTELPARTEVTLHIELSNEERAFYEALRRDALKVMQESQTTGGHQQLQVLAEIMKLRRACCNPKLVMADSPLSSSKLEAFEELVDELLDNKHKALVFSQFVGHLTLIRELLDKKGIPYHYLDGSTPVAKRKQAMNAFQAGEGDLFLISLKAGGTGLNLTAADYVIHMDPWWNPAVEDQASDRAHRMGQKRPVTVYRLVAKDTIEDKIVALHHQKRDLANSLLEGGELSGKMSVDDMLLLLRDVED
jgi:SNF2 family DNA or RNA helicase